MTIDQAALDADLNILKGKVEQLVAAYHSASQKANAAGIDLSAEDALVNSLAGEVTGALTPAPAAAEVAPDASSSAAPSEPAAAADPAPALPLYEYTGTGPVDTSVWKPADVETTDTPPKPLYTFSGDTAGGAPTGATAEWVVYTGPTQPNTPAAS